jgi:hypothetical protein
MESNASLASVIARNFGLGYNRASIISSAALALVIFFYLYTAGTYFQADVYPLVHRDNYLLTFSKYVVDRQVDHVIISFGAVAWLALACIGKTRIISSIIYGGITISSLLYPDALEIVALSSIPMITFFFIINKFLPKKILHTAITLPLNYIGIVLAVISTISLIITLTPSTLSGIRSASASDYAYDVYILLSSTATILILFFIISSPFKLAAKFNNRWSQKDQVPFLSDIIINQKTIALLLLLIMLISVGLALVPHQPAINNNDGQVGADTGYYVASIENIINSNSTQDFFQQVFVKGLSGDRPITLLFLTGIAKIIPNNIPYLVDHIPIVLAPLLVLAVFFLTREITLNDTASLFAAFLTAVSFHELVGIYSGIYANWFALIIGYTAIVFLIKYLKVPRKKNIILYFIFLMALLFSHVYTWTILSMIMGLFLVVLLKLNYYQKKSILFLLAVLFISVGVDYIRTILTGYPGGVGQDLGLAQAGAGQQQLLLIWQNLAQTTQNYSGGQFNNFIIISLGIYWIFRSKPREISSILLLIFLSVGIVPLLFGNTIIQSRYLYDIPLQIPAAIMLTYILKKHEGNLVVFPTLLWLFAVSFKALTNFI